MAKSLSTATKKWVQEIRAAYELDHHHVKLLLLAAEALDRYRQAHDTLEREGLTFEDRFGRPCVRPEVAVERDSRLAFARLVRELGLDAYEPADTPRPPPLRYGGR